MLFWYFSQDVFLLFCLVCGLLCFALLFFKKLYSILGICACFGILIGYHYCAYSLQEIWVKEMQIAPYFWESITAKGRISDVQRRDLYDVTYIVRLQEVQDELIEKPIRIYARIPQNFDLAPGHEVSLRGRLVAIEDFDPNFSYQNFLRARGIHGSMSVWDLERYRRSHSLLTRLYDLRSHFLEKIYELYPRREGIFLAGILLWARESLPDDLKEQFNNSGLTHFIAVSGFNITLCIIFFGLIFRIFPPWIRVTWVIGGIVLFSLFVGLTSPVLRAALAGSIGYLFTQSGYSARQLFLLSFVLVLMVAFSPLSLMHDVSLQLSFLSVLWILLFHERFMKLFSFLPQIFAIREAFALTMSAMLMTLPIMVLNFEQISLVSPLANILVAASIAPAMLLWALSLIASYIHPILGSIVAYPEWLILRYDMFIVQFFGSQSWSVLPVHLQSYRVYIMILFYGGIGYYILRKSVKGVN